MTMLIYLSSLKSINIIFKNSMETSLKSFEPRYFLGRINHLSARKIRLLNWMCIFVAAIASNLFWQIKVFAANSNEVFPNAVAVVPHIHVEIPNNFKPWSSGAIPQPDRDYERVRLGTVKFSKELNLQIDVIKNKIHFPSYYELLEQDTQKVFLRIKIFDYDSANWYFPGNGIAYLNQKDVDLCGPWVTKKFTKVGNSLVERRQSLYYLGYEATVLKTTSLYELPDGKNHVATLAAESRVTVLGMMPWPKSATDTAFLVKTAIGLTGWHVPRENNEDGMLSIYMCN